MSVCLPLLVTTTFVVVAIPRASSAAYCDDHLFRDRSSNNDDDDETTTARQQQQREQRHFSDVQFTKELSTTEYGTLNSFKTLHCCGERYLSLEWFKDNRPYPWPSDVSSFILNPESANQTIYTRSLTPSDHGLYTCQLANQTNIVNHSVQLKTIDEDSYWGDPLPTYQIPVRHYAQPGDSIRLYCEGFVGKIDLPDAVNTISWKKVDGNQTFGSTEKYRIEEVIRENTQVLGAFLFINNLDETDYGRYMCSISNTDDQIVKLFTNITRPVLHKIQFQENVHRDCTLIIIIIMLTSILIILLKRRQFSSLYKKSKKKIENDKYALSEKTVHSIIVFYAEPNEEDVDYLLEKIKLSNNFVIKKHCTDFGGDFEKTHSELIKGYDFIIYILSSVASSSIASLTQSTGSPGKRYIIDYSDLPKTPTKSWCDRVLVDLNATHPKGNHQNVQNKSIRIV